MNRRLFLRTSLSTAALCSLAGTACSRTATSQTNQLPDSDSAAFIRPNILFIYADDWGWGDLSCHGNKWLSTPNIDGLASQGTEFYQFNVNNPVCSPSRTAVMTGHFPARYCVHQHFAKASDNQERNMPDWLDPKAPMISRMFKEAGYVTGHFGKWHLTNTGNPDAPEPTEYGYDESAVFNGPGVQVKVNDACDRAIDFIKRHSKKPFFLNLWVHETHTPHYPSEESMQRYTHLDEQRQGYAAVVDDADRRIGNVLDVLKQLGLENNTLVIFSSDNGPERTGGLKDKKNGKTALGTYYSVGTTGDLRGRKRSLLEGGIRTPFIVKWPGMVSAGKINKTAVITAVDMLPTLCAAAAIKLPADYKADGENVLDAFRGKQFKRTKPIFFEWLGTHAGDNWPCLGVRSGKWKLLMSSDKSRVELYDIPADREESENLAKQHPEVVKKLIAMITKWKAELPAAPSPDCISKLRKGF
jgi:arylsulfatase A-like enzyme